MTEAAVTRRSSAAAVDVLSLFAVTFLSALPYLPALGFYSDDWSIIARSDAALRDGTLSRSIAENFVARPVQGLYLTSLFVLFRLDPLGYHIVNTAVLAGSVCLFYLLLVRLRISLSMAFAAALIFVMLPQLSTVRAWYAAFQVPLSMALMLISLHAQLSFARSRKPAWLAAAVLAALLSIGAYEIFAPLLGGFAAALLYESWRSSPARTWHERWRSAAPAIAVIFVVAAGVAFKIAFSGRAGPITDPDRYIAGLYQLVRLDYDWRVDSGLNVLAALRAYFWWPVRGWATGAMTLGTGQAGRWVGLIALILAILAWWRLRSSEGAIDKRSLQRLLLIGVAVFFLGHLTFLIVPSIHFSATGIGTRVQVAGAIGVAMIFVALVGMIASAAAAPRQRAVFALLIAAAAVPAFVRLVEIESYWTQAPALQRQVLDAARSDLRAIPAGSTIILDGVCPYHGPAIVFETWWDVGGALTLTLGRPVSGDVVSSRLSVTPAGLQTSIYEEPTLHPYSPELYIYDPRQHRVFPVPNPAAAHRYFEQRKPMRCPHGYVGRGVEV